MDHGDIPAKVCVPRISRALDRERLFDTLDEAYQAPLVWICGPGGSGKTMLAASYLASRQRSTIWYQVDSGDSDPATFFHYLGIAGWRDAKPKTLPPPKLTSELLAGLPVFSKRFFEKLCERLDSPSAIVLDDYHHQLDDSILHTVLCEGIGSLPIGYQIIVLSRTLPPPSFVRLQANGNLRLIKPDTLLFSSDEIRNYLSLQKRFTSIPTDYEVEMLLAKTQGWAAGLALLADQVINLAELPDQKTLTMDKVYHYFSQEVVNNLEAAHMAFLHKLVFLPNFTVHQAQELTNEPESGNILANLSTENFFVYQLNGSTSPFRFHPLFAEFLMAQAENVLSAEEKKILKISSGELLVQVGELEHAAELFTSTEYWDQLVPLILTHAELLFSRGQHQVLMNWIEAVPTQFLKETPWLAYWLGLCKMSSDIPVARIFFLEALDIFQKKMDATGSYMSWVGVCESYLYENQGFREIDPVLEKADQLKKIFPEFPSEFVRGRVFGCIAVLQAYRNPFDPACLSQLNLAKELFLSSNDPRLLFPLAMNLGIPFTLYGDWEDLHILIEKLAPLADLPETPPVFHVVYRILFSTYANFSLKFTVGEAFEIHEESKKKHIELGVHIFDFLVSAASAWMLIPTGKISAAKKEIAEAKRFLHPDRKMDQTLFYYASCWASFAEYEYLQAVEHGSLSIQNSLACGTPFSEAESRLAYALPLFHLGRLREAGEHLLEAARIARKGRNKLLLFKVTMTRALFSLERRRNKNAVKLIEQSLSLGSQHGFCIQEGWRQEDWEKVLVVALSHGIQKKYVHALVAKHHLVPKGPGLTAEEWPWPVKIYTLGSFHVSVNGVNPFGGRKPQRKPLELLKLLAASGGRSIPEHFAADQLWPEMDGDATRANMKTTLYRLRQLIGSQAIEFHEGTLNLNQGICWVDNIALQRLLSRVHEAMALNQLELACDFAYSSLQLYRGTFLLEEDPKWEVTRQFLENRLVGSIEELAMQCYSSRLEAQAESLLWRVIKPMPWNEIPYRSLIRLKLDQGFPGEAKKIYLLCEQSLQNASSSLSPETLALGQTIPE